MSLEVISKKKKKKNQCCGSTNLNSLLLLPCSLCYSHMSCPHLPQTLVLDLSSLSSSVIPTADPFSSFHRSSETFQSTIYTADFLVFLSLTSLLISFSRLAEFVITLLVYLLIIAVEYKLHQSGGVSENSVWLRIGTQ